jgi:hypothetical protein
LFYKFSPEKNVLLVCSESIGQQTTQIPHGKQKMQIKHDKGPQ